ncbi:hypothetical protein [Streptomyces kanamyceticus]|uniref:ATP-binding protein n=1 Tax=Streptomyces kanamyceticus TaxID=1967 RepID=A0A5J6GCP0_STRKN|nr:hypothetical protein [Streptomyces kanamyceticus]QEU92222.1 hypothetical protein CP970_16085 [Streptomyces kanamyceticus]
MARNTASNSPRPGARALLRVGLTVTAAGAALGAGGAANASAVEPVSAAPAAGFSAPAGDADAGDPGQAVMEAVQRSTAGGLAPAKALRLNPLAGTSVDPLDNSLGTQIADFKPVSTAVATAPLAEGAALQDLPVVGPATGLLPG